MINQPDPRMADYAQPRETAVPGREDAIVRSASTDGSYEESRQAQYVDPAGNRIENQVAVYQDKNLNRANKRTWVVNIVSFFLGLLETLLALRFFFRLLGANQENSFILFLYQITQILVAPFKGIFPDQALGTHSVFELSTLSAMLVFALLGWGLIALSRVVFAPIERGRQQITTTRRVQR